MAPRGLARSARSHGWRGSRCVIADDGKEEGRRFGICPPRARRPSLRGCAASALRPACRGRIGPLWTPGPFPTPDAHSAPWPCRNRRRWCAAADPARRRAAANDDESRRSREACATFPPRPIRRPQRRQGRNVGRFPVASLEPAGSAERPSGPPRSSHRSFLGRSLKGAAPRAKQVKDGKIAMGFCSFRLTRESVTLFSRLLREHVAGAVSSRFNRDLPSNRPARAISPSAVPSPPPMTVKECPSACPIRRRALAIHPDADGGRQALPPRLNERRLPAEGAPARLMHRTD